eukprot:4479707-Pyramimonas_sp.AAC.1
MGRAPPPVLLFAIHPQTRPPLEKTSRFAFPGALKCSACLGKFADDPPGLHTRGANVTRGRLPPETPWRFTHRGGPFWRHPHDVPPLGCSTVTLGRNRR